MRILIGGDHAGFALKNELRDYLSGIGHEVVDKGPFAFDETDDYPDYVMPLARDIEEGKADRGIVIGGSGEGEAMAANRFTGVRAVVYYGGPLDIIRLSREHNDATVLSLGARFLSADEAKQAVDLWLATPFPRDERHVRRLHKLNG